MNSKWLVLAAVIAALAGAPALAQLSFVYPAKGQSPQQQKKDESECHSWAAQQSGYDPTKASGEQSASAQSQPAAVGGIVGNSADARKGTVIGGVSGRASSRHEQLQRQDELTARAAGPGAYDKARMACLSGRGYSVN